MAKTTERLLFLLDRLYRFRAGSPAAPVEVAVESPVQLVHDVGREAELSAIVTDPGAAGLYSLDQDNVHAAGGETVEATIDPYGTLNASWGEPNKRWVWLMRYAGSVGAVSAVFGAGASATLALQVPALGSALSRRDYFIDLWAASDIITITTDLSGTFPVALAKVTNRTPANGMPLPIPLFPGSKITWRTIASVAQPGTIRIEMLCWIGPFGVYPPGMR